MTNVVIEVIVEILAGALPPGGRYEPRHSVVVAKPKSAAKVIPDIPRTFVPNMIQAIFFDFNGVIINDERIHLKAYREILSAEGVELTDEDYFASLGMDDVAFVRAAYSRGNKALDDETLREVIDREHAKHRELIANDLPVPSGVVSFIKAAARLYDLGIVSMAVRSEIDHVLKLAGLTKQFSLIVSAEPGLKHKPAPDCYERALELLNEKRRRRRNLPLLEKECLVIEDAPPGIASARAAGMRTIGVTTTVAEQALRTAGADIVTPNLADWSPDSIHHLFD
jgi:beta-phosphoglucomutase